MEVTDRFRALVSSTESVIPLDEAALLIAAHAYPGLDIATELARLDALAASCPAPTLDALLDHLFVDLGFVGDATDYYDPRNSYLNDVVTRRCGIPITLSILALSVGRRIGVPLAGVGLPGHFLLRDKVDREVFVDPFAGGAILDRAGCERAFRAVQGDQAPFDPRFLDPVGPDVILQRMLANLRATFAARHDHRSMVWVLELRMAIPGVPVEERAELAGALAATGNFAGAANQFDRLADLLGGSLGEEYAHNAIRLRARLN